MKNLFEYSIVGVIFAVIAFIIGALVFGLTLNFNQGQHTGIVTAVDQPGIIFKNYIVYFKTDSGSSQEDIYCVNRSNDELAKKLKEAARTKKVVTIDYKGNVGMGWGICQEDEIRSIE